MGELNIKFSLKSKTIVVLEYVLLISNEKKLSAILYIYIGNRCISTNYMLNGIEQDWCGCISVVI